MLFLLQNEFFTNFLSNLAIVFIETTNNCWIVLFRRKFWFCDSMKSHISISLVVSALTRIKTSRTIREKTMKTCQYFQLAAFVCYSLHSFDCFFRLRFSKTMFGFILHIYFVPNKRCNDTWNSTERIPKWKIKKLLINIQQVCFVRNS